MNCFGVFAAISQVEPAALRLIAWLHADNGYDLAVARHYEPIAHAVAGVSEELAALARDAFPQRHGDVVYVPNAVRAPDPQPRREALTNRSIRLVYVGRVTEEQKRVSALPHTVRALGEHGVRFELRVVGDGPALPELRAALADDPRVELVGRVDPAEVARHIAWADVFVLPSRYEGQCVALLEAMAAGCVPVTADVGSGLAGVVDDGVTGRIAATTRDDPPDRAGRALAEAIVRDPDGIERMRPACIARVRERHSERDHGERLLSLVRRARAAQPRAWPTDRPAAFTGSRAAGTVPADAGGRLARALSGLAGRRVLLYGAGRHTLELAAATARSPARIVGVLDDHADHGATLWGWPVLEPSRAGETDATDVVLSSHLHERDMWARRDALESQGLRVHRLYDT